MRGKVIRRVCVVVAGSAAVALAAPSPTLAAPAAETAASAAETAAPMGVAGTPHVEGVGQDEGVTELAGQIRAVLGERAEDVSVVIHDRRTGRFIRHNPTMSNHTASVVKVMILVALIEERREDGRALTAGDRALARLMITRSDNDAASTLLRRAGGSQALQRLAARLDMHATSVSDTWGRTSTTAADQVEFMDAIISGKAVRNRSDRRYVLGLMADVAPEQAWGVGAVPAGGQAQVKNGWAPLDPAALRWRVNSVGHVTGPGRDYTMAMLSRKNVSDVQGRKVLNKVARLAYREIVDIGPTGTGSVATATPAVRRDGAPAWLDSPGRAFPPHPVW